MLEKHAKAQDEYDRWDEAMAAKGALLSVKAAEVAEKIAALEKQEAALVATLPGYIQSLAGNGYAKRVFFFEIVECMRKLSIVCVPVFFTAGSSEQLVFALVITFLTFGAYWSLKPYGDTTDMTLALIAQAIIFFTLCSSVAQPLSSGMDVVLTTLVVGFMAASFLLSMPCFKPCCNNGGLTLVMKLFSPRDSSTSLRTNMGSAGKDKTDVVGASDELNA